MIKSISKIATQIGDVKVIVKIDSPEEVNKTSKARLNTVAAIIARAFTPLRVKNSIQEENEIEIYEYKK